MRSRACDRGNGWSLVVLAMGDGSTCGSACGMVWSEGVSARKYVAKLIAECVEKECVDDRRSVCRAGVCSAGNKRALEGLFVETLKASRDQLVDGVLELRFCRWKWATLALAYWQQIGSATTRRLMQDCGMWEHLRPSWRVSDPWFIACLLERCSPLPIEEWVRELGLEFTCSFDNDGVLYSDDLAEDFMQLPESPEARDLVLDMSALTRWLYAAKDNTHEGEMPDGRLFVPEGNQFVGIAEVLCRRLGRKKLDEISALWANQFPDRKSLSPQGFISAALRRARLDLDHNPYPRALPEYRFNGAAPRKRHSSNTSRTTAGRTSTHPYLR